MTAYPVPSGARTPCADHPSWFYPPHYTPSHIEAAKDLCAGCPFQVACAEWGIRRERWGVWGGLTEDERSAVRRARGIVPDEPDMSRLNRARTTCRGCRRVLNRGNLARHRHRCEARRAS